MMDYAMEAMKYLIVMFAINAAYAEIRQAVWLTKNKINYAWVKWGLGIVSIYWAVYYTRSILDFPPLEGHQVYVRGPLMVTIALIGAGAAMSLRRQGK